MEDDGAYRIFGRCDHCYDVILDAEEHEVMTAVLVHLKCVDQYLLDEQTRQDRAKK